MAYQIVAVDDTSPGACVDVGLTWNGSDTLTSTEAISGTSLTLSSTLTGGANTDITLNTDKFTVDATNGNTMIGGTLTQTGAVAAAASITLGAGADLIGSASSDITINTDKFTVAGATGNTAVAGTLEVTGTLTQTGIATFNEAVVLGGTANGSTDGATVVPVDTLLDTYVSNATDAIAATLADGSAAGQMKIIILTTHDTNDMVLTPANMANGSTITFDASGEYAMLVFDGTNWHVVSTNATVA